MHLHIFIGGVGSMEIVVGISCDFVFNNRFIWHVCVGFINSPYSD